MAAFDLLKKSPVYAVEAPTAAGFYVEMDTTQTITTSTVTDVNFISSPYMTSATTWTCKVPGRYKITWQGQWDTNATGFRQVFIVKNGNINLCRAQDQPTASGLTQSLVALQDFIVGDTIKVQVFQDSGANRTFQGNTSATNLFAPKLFVEPAIIRPLTK